YLACYGMLLMLQPRNSLAARRGRSTAASIPLASFWRGRGGFPFWGDKRPRRYFPKNSFLTQPRHGPPKEYCNRVSLGGRALCSTAGDASRPAGQVRPGDQLANRVNAATGGEPSGHRRAAN